MAKKRHFTREENGMASILVTMIMMIVVTLIVIGFAQISIRQQQNTLDSQLNAEANYAAKSGINNAENVIISDINNGNTITPENSCNNSPTNPYIQNNVLDSKSGVEYTCVLVNPYPRSLVYSPLTPGQGQTVPVFGQSAPGNPQNVSSIVISWQEHGQPSNNGDFSGCPNPGSFPQPGSASGQWSGVSCTAGVLQIGIVPASGWTNDQSLIADEHTAFLVPYAQSSSWTANMSGPQGQIVSGNCSPSGSGYDYACYAILNNLPTQGSTPGYYLRLLPFYESVDVAITAYTSATPNKSSVIPQLSDAQATIDSTGKANYVLQRIQERVGINPVSANDLPSNALQSTNSICKQFSVRPGVVAGPGSPGSGC